MAKHAYSPPAQDMAGVKTFVDEKSQKGILPSQLEDKDDSGQNSQDAKWPVAPGKAREKERALPLPSDHNKNRDKVIGPTYYNKNRTTPYRTKSIPGDQVGNPTKFDYNYVRRRYMQASEETLDLLRKADLFPKKRQRNQNGVSKRKSDQFYRQNKEQIKLDRRKKWRKDRFNLTLKRRKKMMRMYPKRYERRGQSPYETPAERTKAWRKEQGQQAKRKGLTNKEWEAKRKEIKRRDKMAHSVAVAYLHTAAYPQKWHTQVKVTQPPQGLSQNYGKGVSQSQGTPRTDPYKQQGESLKAPNLRQHPQKGLDEDSPTPAKRLPRPQIDNPTSGSGKVIPLTYYTDLVNNTQQVPSPQNGRYLHNNNYEVKQAATSAEITRGISHKIVDRAADRHPKLVRVDTKNWMWTWSVPGTAPQPYTVKVQAFKRGNSKNFKSLNLKVKCTCPAFRWQGPEHWAEGDTYLLGSPRGTASYPVIRDPDHVQPLCKHIYAVLEKSRKFFVRPEKSPLRKLSHRVAQRYFEERKTL